MDVLHAWHHSPAGALAGQPAVSAVRRSSLQGRGQDCHEAESGESLRPGVARSCETSSVVLGIVLFVGCGCVRTVISMMSDRG